MLTSEAIKKYVESPDHCPNCGEKTRIEWGVLEYADYGATRSCVCNSCGCTFDEILTVTDVECNLQ